MATFMHRLRAPITQKCSPSVHMHALHTVDITRGSAHAPRSWCSCAQHTAATAAAARWTTGCIAALPITQSHAGGPADADVLPSAAYGQVVSAEANFVRVNISHVEGSSSSANGSSSSSSSSNNGGSSSRNGSAVSTSTPGSQQAGSTQQETPPVKQLLCTVRALLKKIGQRVLVGDHVRVNPIDWTASRGVVDSVQPRSSELADPAVANVDHVLLLFGLTQPPFEPAQVSRFLVSLGASGLPVTLALNKADLLPAAEIQERVDQVAAWGYSAVAVSCETGVGIEHLAQMLAGKVSVVAGPSGAGKSSLINALRLGRHKPDASMGAAGAGVQWQFQSQQQQEQAASYSSSSGSEDASPTSSSNHNSSEPSSSSSSSSNRNGGSTSPSSSGGSSSGSFLAVGDVSHIGRGRHTTRTVTLLELPFGGLMADTPGFNQPTLDRVSSSQLAGLFPEFVAAQEASGGCRFADCMHVAEPGCAVTEAEFERHEHYIKFLAEVKAREDFDVRVMQITKQRREGVMKAKTGRGGETRYEARLNSKKHRTTSRRKMKQQEVWGDEHDEESEGDV